MKKLFILLIIINFVGCMGYNKVAYKSLNQDMVRKNESFSYDIKEAMKKNKHYFFEYASDIDYIKLNQYEDLKANFYNLYTKLSNNYLNEVNQIKNKLNIRDEFSKYFLNSLLLYLEENEISYYNNGDFINIYNLPSDLYNIFNIDVLCKIITNLSNGINLAIIDLSKISNKKCKLEFVYKEIGHNKFIHIGNEILLINLKFDKLKITRTKERLD